jgi:cellulose synthase/poly-beta-1,6-N-acetylglucosamine synthase-like glycosyltransferase
VAHEIAGGSERGAPRRPAISVIVPFHGDREAARSVIDSLATLSTRDGDELIVADNTPGGIVPDDAPGIAVARAAGRRSAYHARNAGARLATNAWLLFMDADCRPPPSLLEDYFEHRLGKACGVVAGELAGDRTQQASLARWARSRRGLIASHHLETGPHPAGVTGNVLVRREAWLEAGGFVETVRSAADVELCWRIQERGWGFAYRPGALVAHRDPERLRTVLRQAWRYGAGRRWLRRAYGASVPRPTLAMPLSRSVAGVVVWTLTARFERGLFKLIDGAVALVSWLGYTVGSNRARER